MLIPPLVEETEAENSHVIEAMTLVDDARYLPSWVLLENFMRFLVSLFVDLVYTNKDLREARTYILQLPSKKAFKLVEDELGYAYDIFYTKAYVRYSLGGTILQFATISITVMVLVCFKSMVVPRYRISDKDRVITYTLLAGALVVEIYAILERFVSKWTLVWLKEKLGRWVSSPGEKMPSWSHSLPCYDFLTLCLEYNNYVPVATLSNFHKQLLHRRRISEDLKSRIFDHMKKSSMYCLNDVIDEQSRPESIMWTKTLEFHQSILTWHIARQMCYYCGSDDSPGREYDDALIFKDISKSLSEYMLFLLVDQQYMLPVGTGLISFRDTRAETIQFLRQEDVCVGPLSPSNGILLYKVCEMLMHDEDAGKRKKYSQSVLRDAFRLVRSLRQMERRKLWELLADVWVEILGHAAINCRADHHAQQLRRGGEFLSHVWLLMALLGLMEQFKLTQPNPAQP